MSQWNGVSFWLLPGLLPKADVAVPLDAAGSLGYGMFLKGFSFAGSRVPSQQQQSIAYKELFPAEIASHVFGATTGVESMYSFALTTMLSSTSRMLGLLKFPAKCGCFAFCCSQWNVIASPNMCKALRIRVLMLSLIVVGRNPGSWLQILSLVQLRCGFLSFRLQT